MLVQRKTSFDRVEITSQKGQRGRIVYIKEVMMMMMMMRINVMTGREGINEKSEGTPIEYVFLLL